MNEVLVAQNQHVALPRRLTIIIRDIWLLQERFKRRQRNRVYKVLHHKRIRAALDFMALRVRAGEDIAEMYEWWQQIYNVDEVARTEMIKELHKRPQKKSRSKRKPRKKEAKLKCPSLILHREVVEIIPIQQLQNSIVGSLKNLPHDTIAGLFQFVLE